MATGAERVVREIMTGSPVTLKPDDTLDMASEIMSQGRIRHIPVVEGRHLLGMISQHDLLGATASSILGLKEKSKSELLKKYRIRDVMRKSIATVPPGTAIKEVAHLMADKRIGCLPVVDNGILVGLVTRTDLLRYMESL